MRLKDKTAVVTGGASGFGEGIVRRFAGEGARVVIADLNGDEGERLARALGDRVHAKATDVASDASIEHLAAFVHERFGLADIIVNNAGVPQPPLPLEEVDDPLFEKLVAVNMRSIFLMARHFVPPMKRAKKGVILNIASTAAARPRPRLAWYNATKGFVVTATSAMAIELAPFGIRVNAISPVAGDTPMLKTFLGNADTPEARAAFVATIPLGRLSTPADVASAAVFLCSDEASMITGAALEVDGGRTI